MPLEEVSEFSFSCSEPDSQDPNVADMRIVSGILEQPLISEREAEKSLFKELPKREEISLQPIPSPRLRKRKRNSQLLKQANEKIEELKSEINNYKTIFSQNFLNLRRNIRNSGGICTTVNSRRISEV